MVSNRSLVASILIIAAVSAVFGISLYKLQVQPTAHQPDDENQNQVTVFKAVLEVDGYLASGHWARNPTTDLPQYTGIVEYSIANIGNAGASSVRVTVRVDGATSVKSIPILEPQSTYRNSSSISVTYDSSEVFIVEATCSGSSDSDSVLVDANLPRSPEWTSSSSITELFITPSENNVASTEDNVIENKFILLPNWVALRDWVGNNIDYKYDSETYGQSDYWQLPKETLQRGTGDCEDFSILLCSLLRANGWSANDVYVVIGEKGESCHAWVKINLGILGWYNIEPQADGWNTLVGDFLSLSGYDAICHFNDSQFHWTG